MNWFYYMSSHAIIVLEQFQQTQNLLYVHLWLILIQWNQGEANKAFVPYKILRICQILLIGQTNFLQYFIVKVNVNLWSTVSNILKLDLTLILHIVWLVSPYSWSWLALFYFQVEPSVHKLETWTRATANIVSVYSGLMFQDHLPDAKPHHQRPIVMQAHSKVYVHCLAKTIASVPLRLLSTASKQAMSFKSFDTKGATLSEFRYSDVRSICLSLCNHTNYLILTDL